MDTFENTSPPEEQIKKVLAKCWNCENYVYCTGTILNYCDVCLNEMTKTQ